MPSRKRRRSRRFEIPPMPFEPHLIHKCTTDCPEDVPDIIEWVCSDAYLNRPNLYPRQGTFLKIIFLQDELFTEYDYAVIGEWEEAYEKTVNDKGVALGGIVPGVLDRIRINKEQGRFWFREILNVSGRRGSKGHLGGLAGSYVLWKYITRGDPQGYYGIDRDKRLTSIVFAGKKEQAKANQWKDLNNIILGAPIFAPYISNAQTESITVFSRYDWIRMMDREERGVETTADPATFEIVPKESTEMAGRGPAAFSQFYDEAAHVVKGVAKADASQVYEAATPALDQFGTEGFIYLPSSPWQMIGLLYEHYLLACEMESDGHGAAVPAYPEMLMIQLASWDIYKDWEIAHQIPRAPGELPYQRLNQAIQSYDEPMRQLEKANPDTFKVERRSHFAAVLDAYLRPERIATIWEPWPSPERIMRVQDRGALSTLYRAHGDPSKSGANFGFAIAHVEGPDERGLPHVVFDVLHAWLPGDYEGHEIDYDDVGRDLADYLDRFMPGEMTFDQFNSVATIQFLQRHAQKMRYPKRVQIYERPATNPLNWKTYETFKTALGLGLIHAPFFELADLELTFLQDLGGKVEHPTAGPVQTKDVADAMAIVTYELIGEQMSAFIGQMLSEVSLSGSVQGGVNPYGGNQQEEAHQALSAFGRGRSGVRKRG